jgi:PKD repeat protein
VTDYRGASTTVTRVVTVANAAPNAASFSWSPDTPRTGQSVTLSGTGSDPEGDALTYRWDLDGDGVFETSGAKPVASFVRGSRKVALKVTDPSGASFTTTRTIVVGNAPPSGDFAWTPDAPLSNTSVHFAAAGVGDPDDGAAAVSVAWDFNDDGVYDATGSQADVVFPHPGPRTVAMRLTDPQGATVVVRHAVNVTNRPPVAEFDASPAAPAPGQDVTLTSRSTDPDGGTLQLTQAWDLNGDGAFDDATGAVAHASFTAGTHLVRLRVTDGNGATTVAERTLVVAEPVLAAPALDAPPASPVTTTLITLLQPSAPARSAGPAGLAPMAPFPVVRLRGSLLRGGVLIDLLRISNVPAAARISASCRGAGCRGIAGALARSGRQAGKLVKVLSSRVLGPGAVLELRVTQPGAIGKLVRFTIRRGRPPLRVDECLTPAGQSRSCR